MRLGFYNDNQPCIITDRGVVDLKDIVRPLTPTTWMSSPQGLMERIITNFDTLRPQMEEAERNGPFTPLDEVKLKAPLPRPGKVLCGQGNFMEGVPVTPVRPLGTFFKSPDAIIGPGETTILPGFRPTIFEHEAELGVVIGKAAKNVSEADALSYVFGYTTAVDVSARAPEDDEAGLPGTDPAHYGKSFDTFLPLGPYITTADQVKDPNNLQVRYWVNEELKQDYNTSDMEHSVAYMISALSHVMTLQPGDLIISGTNHVGLGALQDGDLGEIEIEGLGRNSHEVSDPMKRTWPRTTPANRGQSVKDRRATLNGQPHAGSWPFMPPSTGK